MFLRKETSLKIFGRKFRQDGSGVTSVARRSCLSFGACEEKCVPVMNSLWSYIADSMLLNHFDHHFVQELGEGDSLTLLTLPVI